MSTRAKTWLPRLMGAFALAVAHAGSVQAGDGFPQRPITVVVPFTPGGGVDIVVRGVADRMARDLGVPVIVENKPGGSTVIATNYVSRADPDGYTLLVGTPALGISAALLPDRPPGDPRKILAPVGRLATLPYVLMVSANLAVKTVPDLIAYAKAHPGKLTLANTGQLTAPRMAAELFGMDIGTAIVSVPFRGGGQDEIEITSGRVNGGFSQLSEALSMIQAGARPLAVSSATRAAVLPDVPALAEFIPGFDVTSWNAIYAPAKTPDAVIERLNHALNVAVADEQVRGRYRDLGYQLIGGTPAELAGYLDAQIKKWAALQQTVQLPTN